MTERRKALVLFGSTAADYLADMVTLGLRDLFGPDNVRWWPAKAHLATPEPVAFVPERLCWIGPLDGSVQSPKQAASELGPGDVLVVDQSPVYGPMQTGLASAARARGATVIGIDGSDDANPFWADLLRPHVDRLFLRERGTVAAYDARPIAFAFNPHMVRPRGLQTPWRDRDAFAFWAGKACNSRRARQIERLAPAGVDVAAPVDFAAWSDFLDGARACVVLRGNGAQTYRYWEAAAAGCLVVAERLGFTIPDDFVDGESALLFDDVPNADLIARAVDPSSAVTAARGCELAWRRHTPAATVRYMLGAP